MFNNVKNITGVFFVLILVFCVVNCSKCSRSTSGGYVIKDGKVYYNNGLNGVSFFGSDQHIKKADAETFEIINKKIGKDKNHAYFKTSIITDDMKSFEFLDGVISKDRNNVYYETKVISDRPQSFKILFILDQNNNAYISTDGQKVFARDKPLSSHSVDFQTFERIGKTEYMRDKNNVYDISGIINDADSKTFEVINYGKYKRRFYAKDKSHIYYKGKLVEDSDVASHKIIDHTYHKDKNHVYYLGNKVEKADVNSHEVINNNYHKDKNYVFRGSKIVSDDPENFQIP